MPSTGALHACPANGLIHAVQVISSGDKEDMRLFPFLLVEEVCRYVIKPFPSWKPDLCGSLGCGWHVGRAVTFKDVFSRGVRPVVGSCPVLEGLWENM